MFFKKNKKDSKIYNNNENLVVEVKSWYADNYASLQIQRNILVFIIIILAIVIMVATFVLQGLVNRVEIQPFVIEVEEKTGLTTVVDPNQRKGLTTDEALKNYFIIKYLNARETYNDIDYNRNYFQVVRLLSDNTVYSQFRTIFFNEETNPVKKYGKKKYTTLKIRVVHYLEPNKVQVRFQVSENSATNVEQVINKVATIEFKFTALTLNPEERFINPLGFQVTGYRVDNELM